ncbi:hypothetical protein [Flavobacterium sp. 3HN19-14]|uniref:hypothetical protein n=1 Tax=Flavobacterium sp. 3HN19-14 TaxID=3448133 RepID=UPI003EDED80E
MKNLLYIFVLFSVTNSFSQERILSFLNSENKYEIYVRRSPNVVLGEGEIPEQIIIKDGNSINKIINDWKGKKTLEFIKCGYNCFVTIVSNGKVISRLKINDNCNQALIGDENFDIKDNPFSKIKSQETFFSSEFEFSSKIKALDFIKSIQKIENIYCWNCDSIISESENFEVYKINLYGDKEIIQHLSDSR